MESMKRNKKSVNDKEMLSDLDRASEENVNSLEMEDDAQSNYCAISLEKLFKPPSTWPSKLFLFIWRK